MRDSVGIICTLISCKQTRGSMEAVVTHLQLKVKLYICSNGEHLIIQQNTVKPVHKGHLWEPENVPFIYRLKYALFINWKYETSL